MYMVSSAQVNGAVDAMEGERDTLNTEIEAYQNQLSQSLDDLEREKIRSQQLQTQLEQSNQRQVWSQQLQTQTSWLEGSK